MNVFDLDSALVGDYERFARSFTQIRAPDILAQVEQIYATNRFWPEPLISINPNFEPGPPSRIWQLMGRCTPIRRAYSGSTGSRSDFIVTRRKRSQRQPSTKASQ
jgi:hypothetical protein